MNHDRLLQHQEMCSLRIIIINLSIEHFLNSFSVSQRDRQSVNGVFRTSFFFFHAAVYHELHAVKFRFQLQVVRHCNPIGINNGRSIRIRDLDGSSNEKTSSKGDHGKKYSMLKVLKEQVVGFGVSFLGRCW